MGYPKAPKEDPKLQSLKVFLKFTPTEGIGCGSRPPTTTSLDGVYQTPEQRRNPRMIHSCPGFLQPVLRIQARRQN